MPSEQVFIITLAIGAFIVKWVFPTAVGVILLLTGIVWASQGAGIAGQGSFMDNNPAFINYGAYVAALGALLIAIGLYLKLNRDTPTTK